MFFFKTSFKGIKVEVPFYFPGPVFPQKWFSFGLATSPASPASLTWPGVAQLIGRQSELLWAGLSYRRVGLVALGGFGVGLELICVGCVAGQTLL